MKPIMFFLALSSLGYAQSQKSPPPSQDSLSQSPARKLDAGPQLGLGLGAGTGIAFFWMGGWQINNNYAIEGRYLATSGPGFFFTEGWSAIIRRQMPDIDCYLFAGPSAEYSAFNTIAVPANPYRDYVTRHYSSYYLTLGGGWGLHWFSVELDAMVPVQSLMRTPPRPPLTDNPDAGQSINPFAVYLVLKPHLDLFFFR